MDNLVFLGNQVRGRGLKLIPYPTLAPSEPPPKGLGPEFDASSLPREPIIAVLECSKAQPLLNSAVRVVDRH
jgi:hypothetical protein